MNDQHDISHEGVRLARLVDRLKDGLYMVLLDKTSAKANPNLGWDVQAFKVQKETHVQMIRRLKKDEDDLTK